MKFIENVLNGKYFAIGSRERLKAVLISLVLLLAMTIMIADVYESIVQGYVTMAWIESLSIVVLLVNYISFPKYLSLQKTIYSTVFVLCFLIVVSLTVPGAHPEFALFWLATLPIYIFFFLGLDLGMKWSIFVVSSLVLTTLNCAYGWVTPIYTFEFMIQITVGYIAISYLLYSLEKERQEYEKNLLRSVEKRDILLKEVHHRTKNNMQVMMALLDTQAFKIDNPKYKKMFQSHVERLKAMALVHEHLYSGERYDKVEIGEYLKEITQHLQGLTEHTIITDIDKVVLNMKTAMNLGLVYNEAISNAIAHAYKEEESGIIKVSLKRMEEECVLSVKDYGKGFDAGKKHQTLGVTLMKDISRSLSSQQMKIEQENGTEVKVFCRLNEE